MDGSRVVLTHADSIASEAILEKLPDCGLTADSLILLGGESCIGKRLPFADSHIEILDQGSFDFADCALVLMPEYDDSVISRLVHNDAVLVSHCVETDSAPVFAASADSDINVSYSQSVIRLSNPQLSCVMGVLPRLHRVCEIRRVNLVFLQSAESRGKPAIDELASQTISLLNARGASSSVYPLQIAFNMIPAQGSETMDADLPLLLGDSDIVCIHQTIDVAAFHGFSASVQLEFADGANIEEIKQVFNDIAHVSLNEAESSPISDCNQSFSCVINRLEQAHNHPNNVHFWMIADPMRYGLANNYVNVTDILLKSYL